MPAKLDADGCCHSFQDATTGPDARIATIFDGERAKAGAAIQNGAGSQVSKKAGA